MTTMFLAYGGIFLSMHLIPLTSVIHVPWGTGREHHENCMPIRCPVPGVGGRRDTQVGDTQPLLPRASRSEHFAAPAVDLNARLPSNVSPEISRLFEVRLPFTFQNRTDNNLFQSRREAGSGGSLGGGRRVGHALCTL